jgi:hypothetical protein
MSKSQKALAIQQGVNEIQATQRVMLVLERALVDTMTLERQVRQVRLRLDNLNAVSLVKGLERELQAFVGLIRKRLDSRRTTGPHLLEHNASYSCLFMPDSSDPGELFRGLLSGYVHYEKRTTEAIACLEWSGDFESAELLRSISPAIERSLCVLDIYLEELALKSRVRVRVPALLQARQSGQCSRRPSAETAPTPDTREAEGT